MLLDYVMWGVSAIFLVCVHVLIAMEYAKTLQGTSRPEGVPDKSHARTPSWHSSQYKHRHSEVHSSPKRLSDNMPPRKPLHHRLLDFVEHPLLTLPVGILGGIVGILLYAPVLAVCGLCVVLAFHRAKVVSGESVWRVQIPAYVVLCGIVVLSLYALHNVIDRKLADSNVSLSKLVAQYVTQNLPGPSPPPETYKPVEHTHITYDPPVEAITPLMPFRVGDLPSIQVGFINSGDFQVLKPLMGGVVQVEDDKDIQAIFPRARKKMHLVRSMGGALDPYSRAKTRDRYTFIAESPLTVDDVTGLNTARKLLCVMAVTDWRDGSGEYQTDFGQCFWCVPAIGCEWRVLPEHGDEHKIDAKKTSS
jgi:hypothetical protein